MPLSHYLKAVPHATIPDRLLLFSTRKASLIQIPARGYAALAGGAQPSPAMVDTLTRLGLWVEDLATEQAEVHGMQATINQLNPGVRAAVILGMACNFACRYCYEGSLKGPKAMSDRVADQTIAFLQQRFGPGKSKLVLDFYGGEPLLYPERIKYLARAMQPFVRARGGEFRFTLVTNGSLLTPATVNALLPLGLASCKITLDGPPQSHNRSRPFKNGQESFALILKNIRACCELLPITLGGNFTRETAPLFPALLDILDENGITPDRLAQVKFDAVMSVRDPFAPPGFHDGSASTAEPWLIEATLMLRRELLKRGYAYPKLTPASCMVELDEAMTIDWDGALYKCVTLIGHPDVKSGDVWQGMTSIAVYHPDHWRQHPQCRQCVYLPLCFGGCRYSEYQRCGSMAGVDCQQEYFDQALAEMLNQDIQFRTPGA